MATQKQIEANKINAKKGGRPKGKRSLEAIAKDKAADVLRDKILKEWLPLIHAKIDLALGVYMIKKINGKKLKVYQVKPDGGSIEYLLEIVVGKIKETVDIDMRSDQLDELSENIKEILRKGSRNQQQPPQ